ICRWTTCVLCLAALNGCANTPNPMNQPLELTPAQLGSLRAAARSGDGAAAYRISLYYGSVLFDEKNYRYWLERSAQLGYRPAIESLGTLLLESTLSEDRIRGRKLLKRLRAE